MHARLACAAFGLLGLLPSRRHDVSKVTLVILVTLAVTGAQKSMPALAQALLAASTCLSLKHCLAGNQFARTYYRPAAGQAVQRVRLLIAWYDRQ